MTSSQFFRRLTACAFFLPVFSLAATTVFQTGFEDHSVGSGLDGLSTGNVAWQYAGVTFADIVQVTDATAHEGSKSLMIADQGANRPRVTLDLTAGRPAPAPIPAGSVSLAICEDGSDEGAADCFNIAIGALLIGRGANDAFWVSIPGSKGRTVPFLGADYTYTPGVWNTLRLEFDDRTGTATLFINGGSAGSITVAAGDLLVSSVTLGTYGSQATGDLVFFDSLEVSRADN